MSYLALARKYRPDDFEHIVSQHHITSTLKNAVRLERVSHAYLFCGPRGTGKTTTARVLAKALNCQKGPTPNPCNECTVCKEVSQSSSPDVFEIDAASNRGIDDIRELRENVRYAPVGGKYKIYIIDEVHRLTKEAFDALLKTLEEPPRHVIFIFATTDPQALPPTILSRTQRYDFKRIPVSSLAEAVNSIAQKEGLTIDAEAALMIAKKADGSLRDALSLLDQLSSFSESRIDENKAAEILGLVKTELLSELSESIINGDAKSALEIFGGFIKSGGDSQELADALAGYLRTLMLIKNGVTDQEILEFDKNDVDRAKEMVSEIDSVDLLRFFTIMADYKTYVKSGQDPMFCLEASLVKMSSMDRAVSIEKLLSEGFSKAPEKKNENGKVNLSKTLNDYQNNLRPSPARSSKPQSSENEISESLPVSTGSGDLTIDRIKAEWSEICRFISSKNRKLLFHLGVSVPTGFKNGVLSLKVNGSGSFQLKELSKAGNKTDLEKIFSEFFSEKIVLSFSQGSPEDHPANEISTKPDPDKLFNGSPGVKKLFEYLDGEILGQ